MTTQVDIDVLRQKYALARPTFGETIEPYGDDEIVYHGPSVIWYDAVYAALPALLDELAAARATLAQHEGTWETFDAFVDYEADAQPTLDSADSPR